MKLKVLQISENDLYNFLHDINNYISEQYYEEDYEFLCAKPLYNCTACVYIYQSKLTYNKALYILQSYGTLTSVAYCTGTRCNMYHAGRYSRTTYKHFSRFRKFIREDWYFNLDVIEEQNLELVNWFK